MYKCNFCGEIFDEPDKKKYELCRIDGQPFFGYDHACPICGAVDNMSEVIECEVCGEYCPEHEIDTDSEGREVCLNCLDREYNPYRGVTSMFDAAYRMLEAI